MSESYSSIRQGIASKIAELTGFQETKHVPDLFGRTENTVAHKAFGVGLASSSAANERQRRAVGVYIETPIQVIFSYRLRPTDAYPIDYDLALDTEENVINKVLESYSTNNQFTIRYLSSARDVTDSQEYIIIRLNFTVFHTI